MNPQSAHSAQSFTSLSKATLLSESHALLNLIQRGEPANRELVELPFVTSDKSKSISDLQALVQSTFSIPTCDQRWQYHGQHLNGDETLRSLYFRSGDTFTVVYLERADIGKCDELIHVIRTFNDAENLTADLWKSTYRLVEKITFEIFLPWRSAKTLANRHYFYQQGGIDAFFRLYEGVQSRKRVAPASPPKSPIAPAPTTSNFYSDFLEIACLELMWNFSETAPDRQLIMSRGGLEMALQALVNSVDMDWISSTEKYEAPFRPTAEVAVGCIVQYVEYREAQLITAKNSRAIQCLLVMVGGLGSMEWEDGGDLYSCQVAANTLFCCSCCAETHSYFLSNESVHELLASDFDFNDLAIRYFVSGFVANLRASPLRRLADDVASKIDVKIADMILNRVQPAEVSAWEQSHTYVWVTVLPFLDLAFKSGRRLDRLSSHCRRKLANIDPVAMTTSIGSPTTQSLGVFCIDHLTMVEENRGVFVEERLVDYLFCLRWSCRSESVRRQVDGVLQRFGKTAFVTPPTLRIMCASVLASYVGLPPIVTLVRK